MLPVWIVWLTRKCCCSSAISVLYGKRSPWLVLWVEMFPTHTGLLLSAAATYKLVLCIKMRVFLQLRNTRVEQYEYGIKCWVRLGAGFQAQEREGNAHRYSKDCWGFFLSWDGEIPQTVVYKCTKPLQNSLWQLIAVRRGSALYQCYVLLSGPLVFSVCSVAMDLMHSS